MQHISHYVDLVKQMFIAEQTSLPLVHNLLRKEGCDEDKIMPCVYGACAELLQNRLGSQQQCKEDPRLIHTEADCIYRLKAICPELTDEEVQRILQRIISLRRIEIVDGYAYSLIRPIANLPLEIF